MSSSFQQKGDTDRGYQHLLTRQRCYKMGGDDKMWGRGGVLLRRKSKRSVFIILDPQVGCNFGKLEN